MSKSKQLADRFREVILNGKWVAYTNIKEQLADISWQQATQKINPLHSIAELTFHLHYFIEGTIEVFEGRDLTIRDKYSWDMPAIASEETWQNLLKRLYSNSEKYATHVEALSDEQLNNNFVRQEYGSYERNIQGMIEHSYYHFGQIVLIKKMILKSQTSAKVNRN